MPCSRSSKYGPPAGAFPGEWEPGPCHLCGEWVDGDYGFNEFRTPETRLCIGCHVGELNAEDAVDPP